LSFNAKSNSAFVMIALPSYFFSIYLTNSNPSSIIGLIEVEFCAFDNVVADINTAIDKINFFMCV